MANDEDDDQEEEEEEGSDMEEEVNAVNKSNAAKIGGKRKMDDDDEEEDIETKYDLADYDNEDEIGKNVHCTEWFSSCLIILILFSYGIQLRLLEFYKCKNEILEGHIDLSIDLIYSDCEG